jgi:hypothetical protein
MCIFFLAKKTNQIKKKSYPKSMFGIVVAGAFQITFCAKMHANDFFIF